MSSPHQAAESSTSHRSGPLNAATLSSLADVLALLAGESSPIEGAAEAVRTALGATRVRIEPVWREGVVVEATRPAAEAGSAGVALETVVAAGDRRLALLRLWFDSQPPAQDLLDGAARLLIPMMMLIDARQSLRDERAEGLRHLAEQERFVSLIVDSLPLGLYVVDSDYRIRLWNRGREKGLQGVAREDALGRSIFEVLHRQPAERLRLELDAVFESGEIHQFEADSDAFGELRNYRLSRVPMRFDGEAVTHVIAIGEDITAWKRAQMRSMRAEKLAAVGQLAAGVMHEVNNPLTTIAACAETLANELATEGPLDPGTIQELLRIIQHEIDRCRVLVNDLLGFSRSSAGERTPLDVEQLLDETITMLQHHSRYRRTRVRRVRSEEPLSLIEGSREQLMQVFMAILLNAVDAVSSRGSIELRTRRGDAGEAVVEVVDDGPGIPDTDLARIFEPFFTTKPPGQGTGLGLAISYGIVTDHGGRIDVETVPGSGTTFAIVLRPMEEG